MTAAAGDLPAAVHLHLRRRDRRRHRHDYLQFLLPGILAQTIAMAGIALGQNLNTDIEKGVFDRFRSLPIARSAPLVGAVARRRRPLPRSLCVGHARLRHADRASGSRPARCRRSPRSACRIAFALCFCWISVCVGMLVRTSGAVQGIDVPDRAAADASAATPSSTRRRMPGWLQAFVEVNPITQLVATVRGLMLGGPVAGPPAVDAGLDGRSCWWSSCRWRCAATAAGPEPAESSGTPEAGRVDPGDGGVPVQAGAVGDRGLEVRPQCGAQSLEQPAPGPVGRVVGASAGGSCG